MDRPITNKLIVEKSPYLRLHAQTPINWYPWGSEAFQLAQSQNKPIFLSIGCAQSRLCRVMLKESYEDPKVVHILNQHFINIKVDREELPYVANLYFELAQMLSVSSDRQETPSWPLNVFLTPDLRPFFSINYLGSAERFGSPSFLHMLEQLHSMWENEVEKEVLMQQAERVIEIMTLIESCCKKELLAEESLKNVVEAIYRDVDAQFGGVKAFPKTTHGLLYLFLLRFSEEQQDSRGLFFVEHSLSAMSKGGIFDHVNGGFYHCTIDDRWQIPCFEKRILDNIFLFLAYLDIWSYTGKQQYHFIAKQTLRYLLTDLYDGDTGLFYTSENGENWGNSEENSYYTWSFEDILHLLGEDAALFCEYYGISKEGFCNGRNVLYIPEGLDVQDLAARHRYSLSELYDKLEEAKNKLQTHQSLKNTCFKDDQSLTCYNGWMMFALVQASFRFGDIRYLNLAEKCASFLKEHLYENHRILRRWRDGEAKHPGGLDDYAAVIFGSIALFEAGCGASWLVFAEELVKDVLIFFRSESGGFYTTDDQDSFLLLKQTSMSDGEGISGSALLCRALLKLHILTERSHYLSYVEDVLQIAQAKWRSNKFSSLGNLLTAQDYFSRQHKKVLISLGTSEDRFLILKGLEGKFLPYVSFVWLSHSDKEALYTLLPESEHHLIPNEGNQATTIYLLENGLGRKFVNIEKFLQSLFDE